MKNDLNLRMLDLASFYVGVTESGGDNRGPLVEKFQKAVDGKALGEPWCMAFIQFLAAETSLVHNGANRLWRSESCLDVWKNTPPSCKVPVAEEGAIVIYQHGNTRLGHAGIVKSILANEMTTVEGNTGQGLGVVREGDGVYLRARPISGSIGQMQILGFLKVFG